MPSLCLRDFSRHLTQVSGMLCGICVSCSFITSSFYEFVLDPHPNIGLNLLNTLILRNLLAVDWFIYEAVVIFVNTLRNFKQAIPRKTLGRQPLLHLS